MKKARPDSKNMIRDMMPFSLISVFGIIILVAELAAVAESGEPGAPVLYSDFGAHHFRMRYYVALY